ncbi:MAG: hypothetical protein AAF684_09920, partial [Pseudomonadota bacterium]
MAPLVACGVVAFALFAATLGFGVQTPSATEASPIRAAAPHPLVVAAAAESSRPIETAPEIKTAAAP